MAQNALRGFGAGSMVHVDPERRSASGRTLLLLVIQKPTAMHSPDPEHETPVSSLNTAP